MDARFGWASLGALVVLAGVLPAGAQDVLDDAALVELSAIELTTRIVGGSTSAERVTRAFLSRIAALDDRGPQLGAIVTVNPDALAIAQALDRTRASGGFVGPLHGVPVVLKANIDTADRMPTSAGSLALADHYAAADADVVVRLREAGAVLIGKSNLSEWANFRSPRSTSGWSSAGGQTRNAYVLDRNPCGSSSGSAVAVAARLAPLAIGTETDGSIVCPAAANGVVGIKPAIGTVSQRGIVPLAHSQDSAGPIARSVQDAALLLAVIDTADEPYEVAATSLAGWRVGVIRDYSGAGRSAPVESAYAQALAVLGAAGAVLVDPVQVGVGAEVGAAELELLLYEFKADLNAYLARRRAAPRSLRELIQFNERNAASVMPHFGQELLLDAERRGGLDDPGYAAAVRAATVRMRAALGALFAAQRLDVLSAPTNGPAWRTDYAAGDAFSVGSADFAAISGYPSITVPAQLTGELPLGITFIAQPGREQRLLELAAAFQTRRGAFPPPRFLPSSGD
jgi:amidase